MSATSTQPMTGQTTQAAPFGTVAIIAGPLLVAALAIAFGQSVRVAPAAGVVPADVQAALYAHRMSEKAALSIGVTDPRLLVIQLELQDRFGTGYPIAPTGPQTGSQKGLAPQSLIVNPYTGFVTGTTDTLANQHYSGKVMDAPRSPAGYVRQSSARHR